jgi:hypothetical protein
MLNRLFTKVAIFSISFAVGIAASGLWSTFGPSATQKLDTVIVGAGAALLGRFATQARFSSYERGRLEAARDIKNGILRIKSLGLLTFTHGLYSELLRQGYGVEFVDYGCIGTTEFAESIRGYNDVSKAEIEKRYGQGVLNVVFAQAVQNGRVEQP